MNNSLENSVNKFSEEFYEKYDYLFEDLAKSIVKTSSLKNVSDEDKVSLVKTNLKSTVKISELYVRELSHVIADEIKK